MVLNNRADLEVAELLANAKHTVARLEFTATKMHDIINTESPVVLTVSPISKERRTSTTSWDTLNTVLLSGIVALGSFIAISFYYFAEDVHSDVLKLSAHVEELENHLANPSTQITQPSRNLTK